GMNLIELNRSLRQLRLGGIAAVLETRLLQAQAEPMAPIDFLSCLVCDELTRRGDRLLERRRKQAQFRDPQKTLDNFDFNFNKKMNRSLVCDLANASSCLAMKLAVARSKTRLRFIFLLKLKSKLSSVFCGSRNCAAFLRRSSRRSPRRFSSSETRQ